VKFSEQNKIEAIERGKKLLKELTLEMIEREQLAKLTDKSVIPFRLKQYVVGLVLAEITLEKNIRDAEVS